MDIVVEGSSTVISTTPLLTGDDNRNHDHDHNHDAEEPRQRRGNSIAEVPSSTNDDINYNEINDNSNNEEDERELSFLLLRASLLSFWNNYVKYYCYFSRWLLFVIIINIVAFVVAHSYSVYHYFSDVYDNNNRYNGVGIWKYQLSTSIFQFILLATSIWFFTVAKVIDQQVINLNRMVQYEQAATTASEEEEENGIGIGMGTDTDQQVNNDNDTSEIGGSILRPQLLLPNYDNIYGRVSRKIDRFLQQHQQHLPITDEDLILSTTTSSLINFSYILWSLFLAASFYGITNLILVNHLLSLPKESYCVLDNYGEYISCIQQRTMIPSIIPTGLILMVTSCWLLIHECVPSGIVPFVVAIVAIVHVLIYKATCDDLEIYYFQQMVSTIIVMTSGTILFHIKLFCCYSTTSENHNNNNNNNRLHSWIPRSLLIWALYSWIGAFWAFQFTNEYEYYEFWDFADEINITALVLLAFTGIVLQHRIVLLMGIGTIFVYFIFLFFDFLVITLMGVGLILAGSWIIKKYKY